MAEVPLEVEDPLLTDDVTGVVNSYFGNSSSIHEMLIAHLAHHDLIFKHDNSDGFTLIEKAARKTTVESTVKAFAHLKDGRRAYLAIVSHHAGDTKYKAIYKKRIHLLSNIKWNGRSYSLDSHVSNYRQV